MKSIQKYLIIAAFLLPLGVAGYFFARNMVPFDRQKPAVGEPAPAIVLSGPNGNAVRLSDFRGRVVLLNFWATWCPPCREEMPGFQKVFRDYHDKDFSVIAVAVNDLASSVHSLARELDLRFPVLLADKRATGEYRALAAIPSSFLIAKDGTIIKKVKGIYSEADLRRDVEQALR